MKTLRTAALAKIHGSPGVTLPGAGILLLTTLLSACSPGYLVRVDAITARPAPSFGKQYILTSGMKDIPENDLYFREFSAMLTDALSKKGYEKVTDPDAAQINIKFSYGVSTGENVYYSYVQPVYGFTGGTRVDYQETRTTENGTKSTLSGVISTPLNYHIIGHTRETGSETVYTSFYTLEAGPLAQKTGDKVPFWKLTAKTTAYTSDLRTTMPIMLQASKPFLGENTGNEKHIHLGTSEIQP